MAEGAAEALVEARADAAVRPGLRWLDGVVLAMTMPAALIATLGYSIASLGVWHAVLLWALSIGIAALANLIYAELAGMFPDKPGGISLYATEGWRRHLTLVGPVATFGYWFAWSSSLAVYAAIIGDLVQAEWFPQETWTWDLGLVDVTFARLVGAALLVAVWVANVLGLTPTMLVAYFTTAMLLVPLAVFTFLPFLTGDWSSSTFSGQVGAGGAWGGWKLAVVWLYVMCWTSLGIETCATFTPEYRRGARDAAVALRVSAGVCLAIFVFFPLGAAGVAGEPAIAREPLTFYVAAFHDLVGGASGVIVALLVGSLLLVLNTCMAASARALYGIAADGMTVRQLHRLNRFGVPARAMTVDLLVNVGLLFLLASTLAIVATGNLGYVSAHVFALVAFVLLRRDRPTWPRPFLLPPAFVPVAAALAVGLAFLVVVGATSFDLTGYGGRRELVIALALLGSSLLAFVFRRAVQDREALRLRDRGP